MTALSRADFKYEVTVDNEVTLILREVCPRDFYWFALVENDFPDLDPRHLYLLIMVLLTDASDDDHQLDLVPGKCLSPLIWWIQKNLIEEKVMSLDCWRTSAYHLSKQRWDDSVEWMEHQPMSKVLLMMNIHRKYVDDYNKEMKRASRKK